VRFVVLFLCFLLGCAGVHPAPTQITSSQVVQKPATVADNGISLTFHADTAFTFKEREAIRVATDQWFYQTGGNVNIHVIYDLDFGSLESLAVHFFGRHDLIKRMESWMSKIVEEDEAAALRHGTWRGGPGAPVLYGQTSLFGGIHARKPGEPLIVLLVADRLDYDYAMFEQVTMHELGHILGMEHTNRPGIMRSPFETAKRSCLKAPDLDEFCAKNKCKTTFPCE